MPKGKFRDPALRAEKISKSLSRGEFFPCIICSVKFWRRPSAIKKGDNKFCSKACYFIWQKGRKRSEEFRKKCGKHVKGEKNPFWRGGITPLMQKIRQSPETRNWREAVFKRDNWTCQDCGARSQSGLYVRIEAHHIKPFCIFPTLRFDINNGSTLCKKCHDKKPK